MYELFIANKNYSSWSLRPWVLMRELAIPFTETLAPFDDTPGYPSIANISPSGRVPCLKDGALLIWDSLAITEYLAERHAQVWPTDAAARAWARSAAAEMHSGFFELRNRCSMNCGIRIPLRELAAPLAQELARLDALWQEGLEKFGGPFLAGSRFTAVDAFYAPVAFRVQTYGLPMSPAATQYVSRMLALAPMQAWYEAALQEPWREAQHEAETLAAGMLLADYRCTGLAMATGQNKPEPALSAASTMNLEGVVAEHWRDVPAKELAHPGFSTRLLWQDETGRKALLFEIAPGAVYPELDVHAPGAEEVFVVSGEFCDGRDTYPAGTFIHHPAGSSHIPQSKTGCVLFVFFPEG